MRLGNCNAKLNNLQQKGLRADHPIDCKAGHEQFCEVNNQRSKKCCQSSYPISSACRGFARSYGCDDAMLIKIRMRRKVPANFIFLNALTEKNQTSKKINDYL